MSEVEDLIEDIVRRAIKLAPTQNAIYSERVMGAAALSLVNEEANPNRAALYGGIWRQLVLYKQDPDEVLVLLTVCCQLAGS